MEYMEKMVAALAKRGIEINSDLKVTGINKEIADEIGAPSRGEITGQLYYYFSEPEVRHNTHTVTIND